MATGSVASGDENRAEGLRGDRAGKQERGRLPPSRDGDGSLTARRDHECHAALSSLALSAAAAREQLPKSALALLPEAFQPRLPDDGDRKGHAAAMMLDLAVCRGSMRSCLESVTQCSAAKMGLKQSTPRLLAR